MFYVAKAVAVLQIIVAHMSLGEAQPVAEAIRIAFSQIGVPVFFVCTGFFYQRKRNDSRIFWGKKIKTIIVPYIIMATATFVLPVILSGTFKGFAAYVKWVIGIGSPYWYMSVMLLCFLLFKCICHLERTKKAALFSCVGISVLSVLLSVIGVIQYNSYFNQYTNLLNWIGWFALGYLIREYGWLEKITSKMFFAVSCPLLILFVALSTGRTITIEAYVDQYSLPIEIFGVVCVLCLANALSNTKLLIDIGKKSFFIYLIHIQLAGFINARLPYNVVFFVARPIVAVAVCYVIAKFCELILKKVNLFEKYGVILGLR